MGDVTVDIVQELSAALRQRNWMMATAESCTGGLIAAAITDRAGSSDIFDRGLITYSYEAKTDMLGVPPEMLVSHGAVSQQVAEAMVRGALARSKAHIAVAVTGIAGPGGATPTKPVGSVYIAVMKRGAEPQTMLHNFQGDRTAVRAQTVDTALHALHKLQHRSWHERPA